MMIVRDCRAVDRTATAGRRPTGGAAPPPTPTTDAGGAERPEAGPRVQAHRAGGAAGDWALHGRREGPRPHGGGTGRPAPALPLREAPRGARASARPHGTAAAAAPASGSIALAAASIARPPSASVRSSHRRALVTSADRARVIALSAQT